MSVFACDVLSSDSNSDFASSNELEVQGHKDYYPLIDEGIEDRINNALDTFKINKSNLFSIDNGILKWQIIRKKIYDATSPFIKDGGKIKDLLHFSEYKIAKKTTNST